LRIVFRAQITRSAWFAVESKRGSCCIARRILARRVPIPEPPAVTRAGELAARMEMEDGGWRIEDGAGRKFTSGRGWLNSSRQVRGWRIDDGESCRPWNLTALSRQVTNSRERRSDPWRKSCLVETKNSHGDIRAIFLLPRRGCRR
jgi:hypothetical protein